MYRIYVAIPSWTQVVSYPMNQYSLMHVYKNIIYTYSVVTLTYTLQVVVIILIMSQIKPCM